MQIARIQNCKLTSNKVAQVSNTMPKISFKGDEFEKNQLPKLSRIQKCKMLSAYKSMSIVDYFKALSLKDEEFDKYLEFLEIQEEKPKLAFEYSKLSDMQYFLYHGLRKAQVSPFYALKATEYNPDELDRYFSVAKLNMSDSRTHDVVKFDDDKYAKFKQTIDEGNSWIDAYDAAFLDDAQLERVRRLKDKGISFLNATRIVKDEEIEELLEKGFEDKVDPRLLDAAFAYTHGYSDIKKEIKKQEPREVYENIALQYVSEAIFNFVGESQRLGLVSEKDEDGRIVEQILPWKGAPVKCHYKYDNKGQIEEAIYTNSNVYPLGIKFCFKNKELEQAVYLNNERKDELDIKNPAFFPLFFTQTATATTIGVLLRAASVQNLSKEDFNNFNELIMTQEDEKVSIATKEFEKEFPQTKLMVDNTIEPKYIERLIKVLKTQPKEDLPKEIFLTEFIPFGVAGEFMHQDKIGVAPHIDMDFFDIATFHELQHRKDFFVGKPYGQQAAGQALIFDDKILKDANSQILKDKVDFKENDLFICESELNDIITEQVSKYATTTSAEYIAEFGALMRKGIIGVKLENNEIKYSINKKHQNVRQVYTTITKDEFKKLIKFYLLLGGTPEFNDNFIEADETVYTVSQKEAMEIEL